MLRFTRAVRTLVLSLLLSLASFAAFAQVYVVPETDAAKGSAKAVPPTIDRSPEVVQVFIDPVTGAIRQPEPGEAAALLSKATASVKARKPMTVIQTANGMLMVELDESFVDYLVLRIADDGSLHASCVKAAEVLPTIMRKPVVPARTKWEEQ